jgi:argininosuccinate lyase
MKTIKTLVEELEAINVVLKNLNGEKRPNKNLIDELEEHHMMIEHKLEAQLGLEVGDYEALYKLLKVN